MGFGVHVGFCVLVLCSEYVFNDDTVMESDGLFVVDGLFV